MEAIQSLLERIGSENPPTAEELSAAKGELKRLMRAEGENPNADLDVLQAMRAAYDQVAGAETEAQEREAGIRAQVDEILKDVIDEGDDGASDGETDTEDKTETDATDKELEPVLAGGSVRIMSLSEAAARVSARPKAPEPVEKPGAFRTMVQGREVQGRLTMDQMAAEFASHTRSPGVGKHKLVSFSLNERADGQRLDKLDIAQRTHLVDAAVSPEAVAAAGGCCILPEPIREQTMLSSTARPIRDSLPSFGVTSTGAVTFYPSVCLPQEGAAIWDCADDAAVDPDDPDTWKTCATYDCDEAVVTSIDAIYRCITIGQFQRRFDAERWRAVLQALMASEARLAETHLFSKMRAATTSNHVLGNTGSVFVSLVQGLGLSSEIIRQDQRLRDVQLRLWAPEWLLQAIRSDLVARRVVHIDNPVAADQLINTALGNAGVNVTWTQDVDIIDPSPISGGPLTNYPSFAHMVLAPEGYYTYLDGGQFDLGTEIIDFNLARQNAVAAFAEEFQGLMARGCAAFGLDLPVDVCDLADGCLPVS